MQLGRDQPDLYRDIHELIPHLFICKFSTFIVIQQKSYIIIAKHRQICSPNSKVDKDCHGFTDQFVKTSPRLTNGVIVQKTLF